MAILNTITGPKIHWLAYFWPGLPQLWARGSWAGLLVAVGFTSLANVLLLATLVFSEWLSLETRMTGFGVLAVVWLLARWQSRAERRANTVAAAQAEATDEEAFDEQPTEQPTAERDLLFRKAEGYYLANDWVATEQLLLKMLKQDARDVESRLMLATLWRHQGRGAEALRQLDRLERLEAAAEWKNEIAAERTAIQHAIEEENNPGDTATKQTETAQTKLTENNDRADDDLNQADRRQAA